MSRFKSVTFLALTLAFPSLFAQNLPSFTSGDLVIYRVGDGSTALSSTGSPVFLNEYTTSGVLVGNVALPTSGGNAISASGSATSEGIITLSGDGRYVAFSGYNVAPGTTSIAGTAATVVQRAVGVVSFDAAVTVDPLGTTAYSANNPRGAYSTDGTNIWGVGAGSVNGVWFTNGTAVNLVTGGLRAINDFSNQLYVNTGTAIQTVGTGEPTSGSQTLTALPGVTIPSNGASFVMFDLNPSVVGMDTLYVAGSANSTAIEKFSLQSGGSWLSSGNISVTLGTGGAAGLTGNVNGSTVTLYGTNAGSLFDVVDNTGYNGTINSLTPSLLATADTNDAFRGISFSPSISAIPEPGECGVIGGCFALTMVVLRSRRKST